MSERADRALALIEELSRGSAPAPDALLSDLGIDSLAFAELALALEAEMGADLSSSAVDGSSSVRQVLAAAEGDGRWEGGLPRAIGALQPLADLVGGWALRWWFAMHIEGAANVPRSGPAILAMNHESSLDIPLSVVACRREIVFMAKRELFKNAFVRWSIRMLGGFRVDRDRFDLPAVRMALAVISRRQVLGMYPEGTRSPGELLAFLNGAAWVALRTGSPIVPCAISGTDRTGEARRPRRARVRVSFAPPIAVAKVGDPLERLAKAPAITAEIRQAIEARLVR
jgi:1-acyl-sn-glycerol-3-phosphate acyltransferase